MRNGVEAACLAPYNYVEEISMILQAPVIDPTEMDTNEYAERGFVRIPSTPGILAHSGAEHPQDQPIRSDEPVRANETEPHGMFWFRVPGGPLSLRAHAWFYQQVISTAEEILATASSEFSRDEPFQEQIDSMAAALKDYIECRSAINEMAAKRKFNQEADDAAYQLCQSAKYYIDAFEKAQFRLARGGSIDSDQQIERLRESSEIARREGYAIAQAVVRATDLPVKFNFDLAAKRVVDYSCRRLTEWFAQKRVNQEREAKTTQAGAVFDLNAFFRKVATPVK